MYLISFFPESKIIILVQNMLTLIGYSFSEK